MKILSLSFRLKGEILQPMIVHKIPRRFASRNDTKHIFSKVSINQKGFTLIEIIVSIVVMTIIAVIAGVGLVAISKGYVFSKKNSVITQQGQMAIARLKKEFSNMKSVSSGQATSIAFTRSPEAGGAPIAVCWAGGNAPLIMNMNATDCSSGDKLVEPVTSFNLTYYYYDPASTNALFKFSPSATYSSSTTSMIEMTLQLKGAENAVINFTDRVNLYLETGG